MQVCQIILHINLTHPRAERASAKEPSRSGRPASMSGGIILIIHWYQKSQHHSWAIQDGKTRQSRPAHKQKGCIRLPRDCWCDRTQCLSSCPVSLKWWTRSWTCEPNKHFLPLRFLWSGCFISATERNQDSELGHTPDIINLSILICLLILINYWIWF